MICPDTMSSALPHIILPPFCDTTVSPHITDEEAELIGVRNYSGGARTQSQVCPRPKARAADRP